MVCWTDDVIDLSSDEDEKTNEEMQQSVRDNSRRPIQTSDSRTQSVYLSDHVRVDTSNQLDTADDCNQSYSACDTVEGRVEGGDRRLTCAACREKFKHPKALKRHMFDMHVKSFDHCFECTICNQSIGNLGGLNAHMRIHTEDQSFKCNICDEKFSHSSLLAIHKRIHMGERPFCCSECDKKFTQPSNLKRHVLVHRGEPFICNCCGKTFAVPYSCSYCEKSFARSGDLRIHIRRHMGDKPFSCSHCNKSFVKSWELKVHVRRYTGERPYSCKVCEKKFKHSHQLKSHVRVVHAGQLPFGCKT